MTTATSLRPVTLLQQRETYLRILKDLTIMDDIFMRNVLKDSACTEYILKVIMDQDNLKLKDQILQADYKNLQGRSSILDCIALDNSGRKYNIEFQNADSGASLKRARYHGSLVDANTLETGQVPNELPDTYIIFITTNDTLSLQFTCTQLLQVSIKPSEQKKYLSFYLCARVRYSIETDAFKLVRRDHLRTHI